MAKPSKFLGARASVPASASDDDFAAVIGTISPSAAQRRVYSQDIPLERIRPNPFQARVEFKNLNELADAIRAQGFTSRLRVRPDPTEEGFFQLVYGERRLRAARLAELNAIPCDVANHSDSELIEIGLAENIQRENLNPLEEASAFQKYIEHGRYTIRELAQRLGKNKDYVAGRLSLLNAPSDVQELVAQKPDALTAARRIAQLGDETERKPLIDALLEGTLNKEAVRTTVRRKLNAPPTEVEVYVNGTPLNKESAKTESSATVASELAAAQEGFKNSIEDASKTLLQTLVNWRDILPELEATERAELHAKLVGIRQLVEELVEKSAG